MALELFVGVEFAVLPLNLCHFATCVVSSLQENFVGKNAFPVKQKTGFLGWVSLSLLSRNYTAKDTWYLTAHFSKINYN